MKHKRLLIFGLATGLLALSGWKAFSYLKAPAKTAPASAWVCPMRCLNRVYTHDGECDVCHMRLKPLAKQTRKSLGFICPLHRSKKIFDRQGPCPYCGLNLKEQFDGPPDLQAPGGLGAQWPALGGRSAPYLRPFEVREIDVETLLRAAGPLRNGELLLEIDEASRRGLRLRGPAMVMPPSFYARPVQAEISRIGPGKQLRLKLGRALPGATWGLVELRVAAPPSLAVPLTALLEEGPSSRVFVLNGSEFAPRSVTVTLRGESYAAVSGLKAGEVVAGSGVFWLASQWRMDHP